MPRVNQDLCQLLLITMMVLASVSFLTSCSKRYSDLPAFSALPLGDYENESVGRFKSSYVAEQIDNFYRGSSSGPIGVTTLVNLDDLYSTSTFGRMYSEQLMSELVMRGFDVIELRHADAIRFLKDSGEFNLSREVGAVRSVRDLVGVVVGTYVVSPQRVYVNVRLLDPATSSVLSVASVEMPKTSEIARLIRGGSAPQTLERIPVRHLGYASVPMDLMRQNVGMVQLGEPMWGQFGGRAMETEPSPSKGKVPTRSGKAPHDDAARGEPLTDAEALAANHPPSPEAIKALQELTEKEEHKTQQKE